MRWWWAEDEIHSCLWYVQTHHYGLCLYLKTQWCKYQGLGELVAGKLEAVLERAEIMWQKARVKRFHGADIPQVLEEKGSCGEQNIWRYNVLYCLARSLNPATYEMSGALWMDPVEKKDWRGRQSFWNGHQACRFFSAPSITLKIYGRCWHFHDLKKKGWGQNKWP